MKPDLSFSVVMLPVAILNLQGYFCKNKRLLLKDKHEASRVLCYAKKLSRKIWQLWIAFDPRMLILRATVFLFLTRVKQKTNPFSLEASAWKGHQLYFPVQAISSY